MEIGKQRRQRTPREPLHPSACMFFVIFPSYYHSLCHTHEVAWCPYYPQKRVLHWRIRVTVGLTLHFSHAHTLPSIYILAFTTTNDLARNHSSKVLFFCTTASLTSSVHQSQPFLVSACTLSKFSQSSTTHCQLSYIFPKHYWALPTCTVIFVLQYMLAPQLCLFHSVHSPSLTICLLPLLPQQAHIHPYVQLVFPQR